MTEVRKQIGHNMASDCVLIQTRLLSRVISGIYDEQLRPFGLNSSQFAMLVVIEQLAPSTRAKISRFHHYDNSTMTRNLRVMLNEGWIEEVDPIPAGRGRPIVLTQGGSDLLRRIAPAWQSAQAQVELALGKPSVSAIKNIADRVQEKDTR